MDSLFFHSHRDNIFMEINAEITVKLKMTIRRVNKASYYALQNKTFFFS
jgi:hypothetical protein